MNLQDIWDFFENIFGAVGSTIASIFNLNTFAFPDWLYQGLGFLFGTVGYFFPLYMYMPLINLVLAFWFIRILTSFIMLVKSFVPTISG